MICVLFDKNGNICDFYNLNQIKIYKKKEEEFTIVKQIDNLYVDTFNIQTVRIFLQMLAKEFGESKVIVGSQITGIPFHYFVKLGYEICEADEFSYQLLDQVNEDCIVNPKTESDSEENEAIELERRRTPVEPVKLDEEGNYYLDFIRTQKYYPQITSKKALVPFLSNELFQTLIIECNHIMPWIDTYIKQRNWEYTSVQEDRKCVVTIKHKTCKRG